MIVINKGREINCCNKKEEREEKKKNTHKYILVMWYLTIRSNRNQ